MRGKSYRPANGTEGSWFTSKWCDRCTKDLHAPVGGGCEIVCMALVYDVDSPDYPREWTYGEDGRPICTAFDPVQGLEP